jgi:hypothetical protein
MMSTPIEDVIAALKPWREQNKRRAYRPIVRPGADPRHLSRFGGAPLLLPDESWPACGQCGHPMNLLIQLDLTSLPEAKPPLNTGLLQVFYCIRTNVEANEFCDDYAPFSPCHLLRVIDEVSGVKPFTGQPPSESFPPVEIVDWEAFEDLPNGIEHDLLGLRYDYRFNRDGTKTDVHWDEGNVHFVDLPEPEGGDVASLIADSAERDKLLGWPNWIQGVEYPNCPDCEREMEYFFQIDSEDNVPHMFGDLGCGHVFFCPDHPEHLAFTWACG